MSEFNAERTRAMEARRYLTDKIPQDEILIGFGIKRQNGRWFTTANLDKKNLPVDESGVSIIPEQFTTIVSESGEPVIPVPTNRYVNS